MTSLICALKGTIGTRSPTLAERPGQECVNRQKETDRGQKGGYGVMQNVSMTAPCLEMDLN